MYGVSLEGWVGWLVDWLVGMVGMVGMVDDGWLMLYSILYTVLCVLCEQCKA